jgi:hypothetical protein
MFKLALVTAFVASVAVPVYAMDSMKCDDASMMKMQTQMDGMTDATKKGMAMKEMDMAKASMKDNKMDDCKMHLNNAAKGMM